MTNDDLREMLDDVAPGELDADAAERAAARAPWLDRHAGRRSVVRWVLRPALSLWLAAMLAGYLLQDTAALVVFATMAVIDVVALYGTVLLDRIDVAQFRIVRELRPGLDEADLELLRAVADEEERLPALGGPQWILLLLGSPILVGGACGVLAAITGLPFWTALVAALLAWQVAIHLYTTRRTGRR